MKSVMLGIMSTAFLFLLTYVWSLHSGYLFTQREVKLLMGNCGGEDFVSALQESRQGG